MFSEKHLYMDTGKSSDDDKFQPDTVKKLYVLLVEQVIERNLCFLFV